MDINKLLDEDAFLKMHPLIQSIPKELINLPDIVRQYQGYIAATVRFAAYKNETISINEEVSILIPAGYPANLPIVFILDHGDIINPGLEYHVYPKTGQLCLGNTWEIRKVLLQDPTLNNLMELLVIPHIAGAVFKYCNKTSFPQGEYSHGLVGQLEGIASFFSVPLNVDIICNILSFLSKPKRVANKTQCPFGCGKEYGKCHCKGNFQDIKILFPNKEIFAILREIAKLQCTA